MFLEFIAVVYFCLIGLIFLFKNPESRIKNQELKDVVDKDKGDKQVKEKVGGNDSDKSLFKDLEKLSKYEKKDEYNIMRDLKGKNFDLKDMKNELNSVIKEINKVQESRIKDQESRIKTEKDLWNLCPFEFEYWVCDTLCATQTRRAKDMGIDGFTISGMIPIQAKHMKKVGRPDVDKFETAIRRAKKDEGIMVAFGFSKDAYEEVARAEMEDDLKIKLMTVKDILKNMPCTI